MARRARQHDVVLALDDKALIDAIALDDCLTTVLLFEYAKQHELNKVNAAVKKRANDIKTADAREKDKNWLLIYQV